MSFLLFYNYVLGDGSIRTLAAQYRQTSKTTLSRAVAS